MDAMANASGLSQSICSESGAFSFSFEAVIVEVRNVLSLCVGVVYV